MRNKKVLSLFHYLTIQKYPKSHSTHHFMVSSVLIENVFPFNISPFDETCYIDLLFLFVRLSVFEMFFFSVVGRWVLNARQSCTTTAFTNMANIWAKEKNSIYQHGMQWAFFFLRAQNQYWFNGEQRTVWDR